MNSRQSRKERHQAGKRHSWIAISLPVCVLTAVLVIVWLKPHGGGPSTAGREAGAEKAALSSPAVSHRDIDDFHMIDLNRGWLRDSAGLQITEDGGEHWQPAPQGYDADRQTRPKELQLLGGGAEPPPSGVIYAGKAYDTKKVEFLTERIGWALAAEEGQGVAPLFVTADGGTSWSAGMTPAVREALDKEKQRLQAAVEEAGLYGGWDRAVQAMSSAWTLLPAEASPGDAVLVRHQAPGTIEWQGKSYELQPSGTGFFTYLPIGIQVKPGRYPLGDKVLTVVGKTFETQHLQVTKQMESMRQDTERIQADQAKIDRARSQSQAGFLFASPFIQPVEGILTTPFGYTRYVNGKYDSSHTAIDLAAAEGTPVKAANDGIVALADSLYLTGNSIYVDHGMGLFSQYAHLSELKVKAGDRVKKGDIIGLVGTTGFSTGPHLHFTFWMHNVPVNPNLFFDTVPFHWGADGA